MENTTAEDSRQNEEPEDRRASPEGTEQASDPSAVPSSEQQPEESPSDFEGDNSEEAAQPGDQEPQRADSGSQPHRNYGPSVYLAQRGARRGRRMSLRERRLADRHRGLALPQRPQFRNENVGRPAAESQNGPDRPVRERAERPERPDRAERNAERPERAEPRMSPQKIASLREMRSQVDRVRQALEGVLRDLNRIADQLTFAEKEKDIAEQEIDNLKEQLRRLHR